MVKHGGDRYRNKVDLDFSININPLGMPEGVRESLTEAVSLASYYPDPLAEALTVALAAHLGTEPQELLLGNGASELIHTVVHALPQKKMLLPMPSFAGYRSSAQAANMRTEYVYLQGEKDFRLTEETAEEILQRADADSILFLTNPNNPTGACISQKVLEQILNGALEKGMPVVLDECFIELAFGPDAVSMVARRQEWPNLMILRAFTKSHAIPGVRLGYLVGSPALLNRIRVHLPEWNLSTFAQAAGIACLKEDAYLAKSRALAEEQKQKLCEGLRELGMTVYPSDSIFLLFRSGKEAGAYKTQPESHTAELSTGSLYEAMRKRGILIRDCSDYPGLGAGYYRIAVKTAEENQRLLQVMEEVMAGDAE